LEIFILYLLFCCYLPLEMDIALIWSTCNLNQMICVKIGPVKMIKFTDRQSMDKRRPEKLTWA
jgi:hypothetical protein